MTQINPEELRDLVGEVVAERLREILPSVISQVMSQPEETRLISRKEAMSLLAIRSRDSMNKLERDGSLPPVKINGRVSYKLTDVQGLIKKRRT